MKRLLSRSLRVILLMVLVSSSLLCQAQKYHIKSIAANRIEITNKYDSDPDKHAVKILQPYKHHVDSLMCPVIGTSAQFMRSHSPESLLSNWVADVMREMGSRYCAVDMSVINLGGLRSSMPKGDITFGDIYDITPFQNALCLVKLTGEQLDRLLHEIARVGAGISGCRIVKTRKGELLSATVGGAPIDPKRVYVVVTVDYLAEGNDGMNAFTLSEDKTFPEGAILRFVLIDYIKSQTRDNKSISSVLDGRIEVK